MVQGDGFVKSVLVRAEQIELILPVSEVNLQSVRLIEPE
jgi:hypothetical protein